MVAWLEAVFVSLFLCTSPIGAALLQQKLLFVCFEASLHGCLVRGAVHDDTKLRQLLLGDGNAAVAIKTGLPDLLNTAKDSLNKRSWN